MAEEILTGGNTGDGPRMTRQPRYPFYGYLVGSKLNIIHPGILTLPNETMTEFRVRLQGRTLGIRRDLEPMYRDLWVWWVPLRLCWSGWVDYMTSGGAEGNLPRINGNNPWLGEGNVTQSGAHRSGLPRQAYKLIASHQMYNPPFMDQDEHDVTQANEDALKTLPAPELYAECPVRTEDETVDVKIDLPVADGKVQLSLEDLRMLGQRTTQEELEASGELAGLSPYDQLLRLYGVDMENQQGLREDPELLYKSRTLVWPSRFTEPSTGAVLARYDLAADVKFDSGDDRRYFMEHGLVVTCMAMRWTHRPANKGGLMVHQRRKASEYIPPFTTYTPMIPAADSSTNALAREHWVFHNKADLVDGREELFVGEHVQVGKVPATTAEQNDANLWFGKVLDRTADTRPQMGEAENPAFVADANWLTGAHAQVTGLVSTKVRTPLMHPMRRVPHA